MLVGSEKSPGPVRVCFLPGVPMVADVRMYQRQIREPDPVGIHHIGEAVGGVEGDASGRNELVGAKRTFDFMLRVEDQHVVQFGVGEEEAVVIVHRQAVDQTEVGILFVLDELELLVFRTRKDEDRDRPDRRRRRRLWNQRLRRKRESIGSRLFSRRP